MVKLSNGDYLINGRIDFINAVYECLGGAPNKVYGVPSQFPCIVRIITVGDDIRCKTIQYDELRDIVRSMVRMKKENRLHGHDDSMPTEDQTIMRV